MIINYPLKMEYRSETLRRVLPNAELTIGAMFLIELIIIIILWANRLSKKINSELKTLLTIVKGNVGLLKETDNSIMENSQLIIEVIDQGKRFSPKMLKYGKKQFFMENQSRAKTGHHGLGLYIANDIITKHNGKLILSNTKSGTGLVIVKVPTYNY